MVRHVNGRTAGVGERGKDSPSVLAFVRAVLSKSLFSKASSSVLLAKCEE